MVRSRSEFFGILNCIGDAFEASVLLESVSCVKVELANEQIIRSRGGLVTALTGATFVV